MAGPELFGFLTVVVLEMISKSEILRVDPLPIGKKNNVDDSPYRRVLVLSVPMSLQKTFNAIF